MRSVLMIPFLVLVLAGCSEESHVKNGEADNKAVRAYYVDADQAAAAKEGKVFNDPSKLGPKDTSVDNPSLDQLTKEQDKAASEFVKNVKDAEKKKAYVVATVRLATATMADDSLDPKVKYRSALKLYREALKYDPNNEEAKHNSQQIIDVYKSMGRPVPG